MDKMSKNTESLKKASPIKEGNGETLNRDNPVPSLDELKKEIYQEFLHETIWENKYFKEKLDNIFEKYQNGVETNKVQPNCKKCEFNGDYMDAKCIHCNRPMD